jgi:hypothetical protein
MSGSMPGRISLQSLRWSRIESSEIWFVNARGSLVGIERRYWTWRRLANAND